MTHHSRTLSEVLALSRHVIGEHVLTPEEVRNILEVCDAFWLHSGNPKDPHAITTKGECTNGFVDTLRALRYTNLCDILALSMVNLFLQRYPEYHRSKQGVSWVIGSDHAGAALSHSVATWLHTQHDFTEKGPVVDGKKTQRWSRFDILPDETVLQIEELITTTGTLQAVREGIRAGNKTPVQFLPVAMTLIHRSDQREFEGGPILYLAHFDIQVWKPDECPLCKAGSKRILPKINWAELTGKS